MIPLLPETLDEFLARFDLAAAFREGREFDFSVASVAGVNLPRMQFRAEGSYDLFTDEFWFTVWFKNGDLIASIEREESHEVASLFEYDVPHFEDGYDLLVPEEWEDFRDAWNGLAEECGDPDEFEALIEHLRAFEQLHAIAYYCQDGQDPDEPQVRESMASHWESYWHDYDWPITVVVEDLAAEADPSLPRYIAVCESYRDIRDLLGRNLSADGDWPEGVYNWLTRRARDTGAQHPVVTVLHGYELDAPEFADLPRWPYIHAH
ncbi:MAG TPA: hypothetical protein VFD32_11650 [Dehalococcoidia bacterium]|nr:hypothetical protein [Dehalococcoidia bacterium]